MSQTMRAKRRGFLKTVALFGSGAVSSSLPVTVTNRSVRAEQPNPTNGPHKSFDIHEVRTVSVLSSDVLSKIHQLRKSEAMYEGGCYVRETDHGPRSRSGVLPRLPIRRNSVYTGIENAGTYNHHSQLAKFRGRYYFAWSNGRIHEDQPGQKSFIATSDDCQNWSEPQVVAPADEAEGILRWTSGLYADKRQMVLYSVAWHVEVDPQAVAGRHFKYSRLDAHVSTDGQQWQSVEGIGGNKLLMFEEPRPLGDGRLMAGGTHESRPIAMFWKVDEPAASPEIVLMPKPTVTASFNYGEASWYKTPDGDLVMWFRDEANGLRLFVAVSEDNGRSWTEPMPSDFPDSTARIRAGHLSDGRCYLIGNSYPKFLDRRRLMLALSEDGMKFDRMFILLDDPTQQRAFGMLKVHGYQYPVAIEDGDRLLVGYSVNKEDIECGVIPLEALI